MNRWPATCNLCGAPLMNGRCPRCGFERKKEGSSVYSGAEAGGFVGPSGIEYAALGTKWAAGTTVSLASVAMPTRGLLCVYTVSINDGSVASFPTVTWGAQTLSERQGGGVDLWRAGLKADLVDPGTRTLILTHNDPAITSVGMIVFALTEAVAYSSATETNSGGTPATTIAYSKDSVQAPRMTVASLAILVESTSIATSLASTGTVRQTLAMPDSVGPAFLYHVAQPHTSSAPFTLDATLSAARDWYVDGHTFR